MQTDGMIALTKTTATNPHLGAVMDRSRGFQLLVDHARSITAPAIVETGCVRQADDWEGAGCSTLILAAAAQERDGSLVYVDNNQTNLATASHLLAERQLTHANALNGDSVSRLRTWHCEIDVLYLDSLDTTEPNHAEHGLAEVKAALPFLKPDAVIGIDDSPPVDGVIVGKGRLAVPFLVSAGWSIIHAGYQVVLQRKTPLPILVSGPGRSGSTFLQFLLSQHPDCEIYGQTGCGRQGADVWSQLFDLRKTMRLRAAWMRRTNDRIGYEVPHYSGSDRERGDQLWGQFVKEYFRGDRPDTWHWGIKSNAACVLQPFRAAVNQAWGGGRYVMCIRDPWETYLSLKGTFAPQTKLVQFLETWIACATMPAVQVFQIDRIEARNRIEATSQLLSALGLTHCDKTIEFVRRWPPVHRIEHRHEARVESDEVRQAFDAHPDWPRVIEGLGYDAGAY